MAEEQRFDAGDEIQVKQRLTKAQRIREKQKKDLHDVLSTEAGKRLLWRILGECGIHRDPFSTNALTMASNVGAQRVGRFIEFEIAESCPEKYLEMQVLAQKEEANG